MKYKSLGIIGPGNHFKNRIAPIIKRNNFFKIDGFLKKKKINKKNYLSEAEFFKKKFDFVYISCPNQLHEKYIVKSLNSGFNVICEKPFVINSKNIKKIVNLSKIKKKFIFECFMYAYHPVFSFIKRIIKNKKLGPINYVLSNFKFPSLQKSNNRYSKKLGNGFFYDAAVYPLSLENYLFESKKKYKIIQKTFKGSNDVDSKGYIFLQDNLFKRFYFWGEGQNYSNNLEIFFQKGSIYIDKFYSKKFKEKIYVKVNALSGSYIKEFKGIDQFEMMFEEIKKNYFKDNFKKKCRKLIYNQSKLLTLVRSS